MAEAIGDDYSYWNLGLGYGRAQDAASDGAWLYKAKHMDAVVMCYGINDVVQGRTAEQIEKDLLHIILKLKAADIKVLLQTVPPFDLKGENLGKWLCVNGYIRETLAEFVDEVFDVVPVLIKGSEEEGEARYGGHPNEEGHAAWAKALIPIMREF